MTGTRVRTFDVLVPVRRFFIRADLLTRLGLVECQARLQRFHGYREVSPAEVHFSLDGPPLRLGPFRTWVRWSSALNLLLVPDRVRITLDARCRVAATASGTRMQVRLGWRLPNYIFFIILSSVLLLALTGVAVAILIDIWTGSRSWTERLSLLAAPAISGAVFVYAWIEWRRALADTVTYDLALLSETLVAKLSGDGVGPCKN